MRLRLPGVLWLYIARRFTAAICLMVIGVVTIVFLVEFVELIRKFGASPGFTVLTGLKLALMRTPTVFEDVLPFAFLFGSILCLLQLSKRLELVIARATGVSAWKFLTAPIAIAILFGVISVMAINPITISLKSSASRMEAELAGNRKPDKFEYWFRQDGRGGASIIRARGADTAGLRLFDVTAFVFNASGGFHEKIKARSATFRDGQWTLTDTIVTSTGQAPVARPAYMLDTFLSAEELRRTLTRPGALSVWSLPTFIGTAARTGLNTDRFRLAFHAQLARPLLLVAMVMIAATVSLRLFRHGGTGQLVLTGIAAGFLLYVLTKITSDLGGNGIINPMLAAWGPSIIALTFGATALLYLEDG
jgi:lipopolysaccharide export system permease protein